MNSNMPGMPAGSSAPLNASDFNLKNQTQAMDFLSRFLDDSTLQVDGNHYATYFWYGVVVLIGLAALQNVAWRSVLMLRNRKAAASHARPAASATHPAKAFTFLLNIGRKLSYPQFPFVRAAFWIQVPPFGTVGLVLLYFGFIMALEFINNDVAGAQYYTSLAIRAAWLAVAQVPLLVLLAGKNNLIGLITGVSYERINVLHRWVARGLLLLTTIHMAVWNFSWNKYGVWRLEWNTDTCPPTGFAAYGMVVWLNISTFAPFRNFSYDFFVFQHLITFFGFIVAVMYHIPSTALHARVYVWIPIGLYILDRLIRTLRLVWNNASPTRATLEAMIGNVTKVRITNRRIKKWSPGSHVLLSIPRFGIGQSHPATILSTPSSHDGDMVFLLRAHKGFTKRILSGSNSSTTSLLSTSSADSHTEKTDVKGSHLAVVDGPYGGSQADFASFDTVLLIAGSTGVTFTLSLLLDLAHRVSTLKLPVRRIEFVWVVKSEQHMSWVSSELESAVGWLQNKGIDIRVRIFVTCSDRYTHPSSPKPSRRASSCHCDTSTGQPCCCATSHAFEDWAEGETTPQSTSATARPIGSQSESVLQCASVESGRPLVRSILSDLLAHAEGETGIACCGPLGLNTAVRSVVAGVSSRKPSARQGVYLHVEGFSW